MEVKVECGRFVHNGIVHLNGDLVDVDGSLTSIQTLLKIGDLTKTGKEPAKEDAAADWHGIRSKKKLDEFASEKFDIELDRRQSLDQMKAELEKKLAEKETPEETEDAAEEPEEESEEEEPAAEPEEESEDAAAEPEEEPEDAAAEPEEEPEKE